MMLYVLLISLMNCSLSAMENREDQSKDSAYQAGYLLADFGFKLFFSNATGELKGAHTKFEKYTFISEKYSEALLNSSLPAIEEYINNVGELDRIKKEEAFLTGFTSYYRTMGIFLMRNSDICFVPTVFLSALVRKKEDNPNAGKDRYLTIYHQKLRQLETDMQKKLSKATGILSLDNNQRLTLIKNNFRYIE